MTSIIMGFCVSMALWFVFHVIAFREELTDAMLFRWHSKTEGILVGLASWLEAVCFTAAVWWLI